DVRVGGRLLRLCLEAEDAIGADETGAGAQRLAAVNVAQARVAVRRHDAESDQRTGLRGDDGEGGADGGLKLFDRGDHVIRGDDGHDRVPVAVVQDGRGKADGVGGVAAGGLAEA